MLSHVVDRQRNRYPFSTVWTPLPENRKPSRNASNWRGASAGMPNPLGCVMSGSKWLTPDCKYILDYGEVQGRHYVWADTYPRQNEYARYSRIGSFDC